MRASCGTGVTGAGPTIGSRPTRWGGGTTPRARCSRRRSASGGLSRSGAAAGNATSAAHMRVKHVSRTSCDRIPYLPVWCLLAAAAPAGAQAPPPRAFVGATLIDGTGAAAVANAVVAVRDGRITCAGPRASCPVPAGTEIVDVTGRWVLPCLVDAHVHY